MKIAKLAPEANKVKLLVHDQCDQCRRIISPGMSAFIDSKKQLLCEQCEKKNAVTV